MSELPALLFVQLWPSTNDEDDTNETTKHPPSIPAFRSTPFIASAGLSHCMNELEVGTAKVTVQHHHKMSLTPCLTPGEQVNLMTVAQYQAAS